MKVYTPVSVSGPPIHVAKIGPPCKTQEELFDDIRVLQAISGDKLIIGYIEEDMDDDEFRMNLENYSELLKWLHYRYPKNIDPAG